MALHKHEGRMLARCHFPPGQSISGDRSYNQSNAGRFLGSALAVSACIRILREPAAWSPGVRGSIVPALAAACCPLLHVFQGGNWSTIIWAI